MTGSQLGTASRLGRALAAMFGVHVQFAQREAKGDLGRLLAGLFLLATGGILFALALAGAHVALTLYLLPRFQGVWLHAVGAVAVGDLLMALLLLLWGRSRLRKPLLAETRSLVRRTVEGLAELNSAG